MKKIKHPTLTSAKVLTPVEMNHLHFEAAHSALTDRPAPQQTTDRQS